MNTTAWPGTLALRLTGVTRRFPGVTALDRVDLDLHRGEVHALLGENGAGKSTLIKILAGVQTADEGDYWVAGQRVAVTRPAEAQRLGIALAPQDVMMVPELSVGRNILLGGENLFARKGRLSARERGIVQSALVQVGAGYDPETRTSALSAPHLRLAQLARALAQISQTLILDEPTAVLSEPDAEHLLDRVMQLRGQGKAVLYVTHRLSEVVRIADRITILRDGRRVGVYARGEITRDDMVRLMAKSVEPGAPAAERLVPSPTAAGAGVRLSVERLSSGRRFRDVSFTVEPGRIVGIAGVQGSGHGHLARAIAGADAADEGEIRLDGETLPLGAVRKAVARGVLMTPADRRGAAIVPEMSVRANLSVSGRIRRSARRFGLRWGRAERAMAREHVDRLSVRPGSTETRVGALSGGNQQKVALARAFESAARALIVEEPTQGVDVGAKREIHALLRSFASERRCPVVIATSEFEELLGLADEIHVMREGRIVASFPAAQATYRRILENALS